MEREDEGGEESDEGGRPDDEDELGGEGSARERERSRFGLESSLLNLLDEVGGEDGEEGDAREEDMSFGRYRSPRFTPSFNP